MGDDTCQVFVSFDKTEKLSNPSVRVTKSKSKNSLLRVSTWITMIWLLTGQFWSATSAFLYLILTVVKTINIINPFYRLKTRFLYTVIFIVLLIYFTLFITDNYYGNWLVSYATYGKHKFKCSVTYGLFAFFDTTASTGELTLTYIFKRLRLIIIYDYVASALLVLEFCLPGIIVLVCMMLQMFYIRRSLGRSENPMANTANHVNLSVFLTSLLYFISVSVFSYFLLVLDIKAAIGVNITDFSNLILIIGKYTLPLLNAALFPTILILRKPELKAIFKNYVMKILLLPLTIFYKLQSVVLRRSGYTQI